MIHGVLIVSEEGDCRLLRFYDELTCEQQQAIVADLLFFMKQRSRDASNFIFHDVGIQGIHGVYRKYARLYFAMLVDDCENDLAVLDLIQCYVEVLDGVFNRVCEMDLLLNLEKSNLVLDELICGGIVINNNAERVLQQYKANMAAK